MDEHEYIDQDAVDAFIEHCKKSKKEVKKMKSYERQFLEQYLDPENREYTGETEDE